MSLRSKNRAGAIEIVPQSTGLHCGGVDLYGRCDFGCDSDAQDRTRMRKVVRDLWGNPFLWISIAVGLGLMLWFDFRFVPFMGLLTGPPDTNSFPTWGIPALLAGLFGFLRPKPKEVWNYGLLMWTPRAIRFGTDWLMHPGGWLKGLALKLLRPHC